MDAAAFNSPATVVVVGSDFIAWHFHQRGWLVFVWRNIEIGEEHESKLGLLHCQRPVTYPKRAFLLINKASPS